MIKLPYTHKGKTIELRFTPYALIMIERETGCEFDKLNFSMLYHLMAWLWAGMLHCNNIPFVEFAKQVTEDDVTSAYDALTEMCNTYGQKTQADQNNILNWVKSQFGKNA